MRGSKSHEPKNPRDREIFAVGSEITPATARDSIPHNVSFVADSTFGEFLLLLVGRVGEATSLGRILPTPKDRVSSTDANIPNDR